jgi:hypothetical protein
LHFARSAKKGTKRGSRQRAADTNTSYADL